MKTCQTARLESVWAEFALHDLCITNHLHRLCISLLPGFDEYDSDLKKKNENQQSVVSV